MKHVCREYTRAMMSVIFAAVAFFFVLPSRALTTIDVADNATYDLDIGSDANKTATQGSNGTVLKLGTGCTVRLVSAADGAGADFLLKAGIWCPSGDVTIDGSALSGYSSNLRICGCVWVNNGTVTLKGFSKATFGSATLLSQTSISAPCICAADVLFDPAAGAEGIEFVNTALLINALKTCRWTAAAGSTLWGYRVDTFAAASEPYVADGWTIGLVKGYAVSNETLRVTNGGKVLLRQCDILTRSTQSASTIGSWSGTSNDAYVDSDIVLDGNDTEFAVYSNVVTEHQLRGDISGSGSFKLSATKDNNVEIHFKGKSLWTGETWLRPNGDSRTGTGILTFDDPAPATSRIVMTNETCATVRFRPTGYGASPTSVRVNAIYGDGDAYAVVEVAAQQTLTVGALDGGVTFSGDSTGQVVVESLAAGATIRSVGGVKVQVLASADGRANVVLGAVGDVESGSWELSGPASGAAIAFNATEVVQGGRIAYAGSVDFGIEQAMSDKIALWCDASNSPIVGIGDRQKDESVSVTTSEGYPYLWAWKDRRPEQTAYWFGNKRFETASITTAAVFPDLASADDALAPNGHAYVEMRGNASHFNIYKKTGNTTNTTANIASSYAIVVYGSQPFSEDRGGGGSAILGNQNGLFYRGTPGSLPAAITKYAIMTNSLDGFVDGVSTNLSTAKFNSGWQVISVDTDGIDVQGLGFGSNGVNATPDNRGYTRYAEVMIFGEKPTEIERMILEERLATKYGLPMAHSDTAYPLVADLNVACDAQTPVLTLADETRLDLTVNLAFAPQSLRPGRYPLVAGADLKSWALGAVTGNVKYEVRLSYDSDAKVLYADVIGPGIIIILK